MINEDKGIILTMLEPVVKMTRAGENIVALLLEGDYVKFVYASGDTAKIPISGDSGIQLIIDVCRALQ